VAKRFGVADLNRGDFAWPDDGRRWQSRNIAWPCAVFRARNHGDPKALDFLRQGQAIMARLTKPSPDNATWTQDLAGFNQEIAELAPLRPEHGRKPRTPLSRR
jgi:hypothetical protein